MEKIKVLVKGFIACVMLLLYCSNSYAQSVSASLGGGCYSINGLYVSMDVNEESAKPILGHAAEENTLLTYMRDNGVNYLICYELQQILPASAKATQLAAFIKKAKTQYGVQQIGAALGTGDQANLVVAYNNSHTVDERIDVLNLEDEFWNNSNRTAAFNETMKSLRTFATLATANNLETEIYIGQILQNEGIQLANTVDRVLVHFYRQTDVNIIDYNTVRLQYLGSGNKKVRIAPIFSAETPANTGDIPFMGTWLKTHPQDQAIKSWLTGYNALSGSWKSNLEIMGATWFSYDAVINPNGNDVYVIPPRHITIHPQSQAACNGQTISFTVVSSASVKSYYWMKDGRCLSDANNISGSKSNVLTISNFSTADAASYHCRVVSYDTGNPSSCSSNAAILSLNSTCNDQGTQAPYNGIVGLIPGTIEAENYDTGGQGIAYNDGTSVNLGGAYRTDGVDVETTAGGYDVGYITNGEWLEYTVDVSDGNYQIEAVVAAITSGKTFQLQLNGAVIANLTVPNTGGWATWQKVTLPNVTLTSGRMILRLLATSADFNVDRLIFTKTVSNQPPVVMLTAPLSTNTYTAPASITLTANASDSDGSIAKVEFYSGSLLLGTDVNSPYSYTWSSVSAGSYTLSAKAYDNVGLSSASAATVIIISPVIGSNLCTSAQAYMENAAYVAGSLAQNNGRLYQCKPFPYSGWCNGAAWAYAPGAGAYWSDAWIDKGSCNSRTGHEASAQSILLVPNPSYGIFTLQSTQTVRVSVYTTKGVLLSGPIEVEPFGTIDLTALPADVYIVKLEDGQSVTMSRVLKQ